jgi:hypothetical protein
MAEQTKKPTKTSRKSQRTTDKLQRKSRQEYTRSFDMSSSDCQYAEIESLLAWILGSASVLITIAFSFPW